MRASVIVLVLASCSSASEPAPPENAVAPVAEASVPDVRAESAAEAQAQAEAGPDVVVGAPIDAVVDAPWDCKVLTASPPCPTPATTYGTVKPLFDKYCVSCHQGDAGADASPEDMSTYAGAVFQQNNVRLDLWGCTMPNAAPYPTDTERQRFLEWLACGTPQ